MYSHSLGSIPQYTVWCVTPVYQVRRILGLIYQEATTCQIHIINRHVFILTSLICSEMSIYTHLTEQLKLLLVRHIYCE